MLPYLCILLLGIQGMQAFLSFPFAADCRDRHTGEWQRTVGHKLRPFILEANNNSSEKDDEDNAQPSVRTYSNAELTTSTLRKIDNQGDRLAAFIRDCEIAMEEEGISAETEKIFLRLLGAALHCQYKLESDTNTAIAKQRSERVANVDEGLGTEMNYNVDLNKFAKEVEALFQWINVPKVKKEYIAPYFALIQSSGMGKTKLLKELRDSAKLTSTTTCMLVVCATAGLEKVPQYFDSILRTPQAASEAVRQKNL